MQYKIKIESDFKELKADLTKSQLLVDKITKSLNFTSSITQVNKLVTSFTKLSEVNKNLKIILNTKDLTTDLKSVSETIDKISKKKIDINVTDAIKNLKSVLTLLGQLQKQSNVAIKVTSTVKKVTSEVGETIKAVANANKSKLTLKSYSDIQNKLEAPLERVKKSVASINTDKRYKVQIAVGTINVAILGTLKTSLNALGRATKSVTGFLKSMTLQLRVTENGVNFLVRSSNALGTALTYVGSEGIEEFLKVEDALNRTRTLAGASRDSYDELAKATLKVAESSSLTAREIAKGSEIFALAGFNIQDIIDIQPQLVTSVINSGESIKTNADNITSSVKVWDTHMDVLGDTIDKLTSGMSNAKTSIGDLGRGMANAGSVFKQTGRGTSELIAAIQVLGDQAFKGAEGGNALKTILLRLAAPTGGAQKLLNHYGITLKEAGSNSDQLADVTSKLNLKLGEINSVVNDLSISYNSGNTSIAPFIDRLEALGVSTRTATGSYKSMGHVVEQLARQSGKLSQAQVDLDTEFTKTNSISNKLAARLRFLGVESGVSGGKIRSLTDITEDLSTRFEKLSQAEKLAFADKLIGKMQAAKFLAIMNAAKKTTQEIKFLGEETTVYMSTLRAQTLRQDLASKSGRIFATVYKAAGGTLTEIEPDIKLFGELLDHNSKAIIKSNGDVSTFVATIYRFTQAGYSWQEAIKLATDSSVRMNTEVGDLNTVLGKLGSTTKFNTLNEALNELKRHVDRSSDTQVLHAFNGVLTNDVATAMVKAANASGSFGTEMNASLAAIGGQAIEMRGEMENTTQYLVDVMISSWRAALFKIFEAFSPVIDKVSQIGTIASQVLGDLLPPLVANLVQWLEKFDISTQTVRESITWAIESLVNIFMKLAEVVKSVANFVVNSGFNIDTVFAQIKASFEVFMTVLGGIGKALNWLGLISDANAASMETAFDTMKGTVDGSTTSMNSSLADSGRKFEYWGQTTEKVTSQAARDAEAAALRVLGSNDDMGDSWFQLGTDTETASTSIVRHTENMQKGVVSSVTTMATDTSTNFSNMSDSSTRTVSTMASDLARSFEALKSDSTQKVSSMATDIDTSVSNLASNATTKVSTMATDIDTTVTTMAGNTTSKIGTMATDSVTSFTNLNVEASTNTASMSQNVTTSVDSMATEVVSDFSAMKTASGTTSSNMSNEVSGYLDSLQNNATISSNTMRTNVNANVTALADNATLKSADMASKMEVDFTKVETDSTTHTEGMKAQVVDKTNVMKDETIGATESLSNSIGSIFVSLKDNVVSQASSMYENVTEFATKAATQAANVAQTVQSTISTTASSISDFMSSSSISDYMNSPNSITESMQNTTIDTGSGGLLNSINSGTHYVPESVLRYNNEQAIANGADPRYLPPDSYDAGIQDLYGLSPGVNYDFENWWQASAQSNPDKYQEYVDAGLHDGRYITTSAVTSDITKTQNADGSITYSGSGSSSTSDRLAEQQLAETQRTNQLLGESFNVGNFTIGVY